METNVVVVERANGANEVRKARGEALMGGTPIPLGRWRAISGMTVENEGAMTEQERRAAIRKLKESVEVEIRSELRAAKNDLEFAGERSFLWEPGPAVCRRLEIAPAALSRLMRELTGMSVTQMVDKIRAEGVKEKLRENLVKFLMENFKKPGVAKDGTAANFWSALRALRRQVRFSYATWAIEMGFSNYTRFYRACLLAHKMTPSQIEDEILREFEEWFTVALELLARVEAKDSKSWDTQKHRPPYSDGWTEALKTRREWVFRMQRELAADEGVMALSEE